MKIKFVKTSEITPKTLQEISLEWSKEFIESNICEDLNILNNDYPGILEWYIKKVRYEIENKDNVREIILAFVNQSIAGIAILKNDGVEKKICTIRIREKYRNKGIGTKLFEESFKWLGTRTPLITISETNKNAFNKIIKKYKFKETGSIEGKYVEGKKEYIYNGN